MATSPMSGSGASNFMAAPPSQQFDPESTCGPCNGSEDPSLCCQDFMRRESLRNPPSWFDALTLVGGFATVVIVLVVCCLHKIRQQSPDSGGGRRRANRWLDSPGNEANDSLSDSLIVYVDLNAKQAFPLHELPDTPAAPDDAAQAPEDRSTGGTGSNSGLIVAVEGAATSDAPHDAAALPQQRAGVESTTETAQNAASRIGQAVLRGTAFVLFELPLWTGQRVSRILSRIHRHSTDSPPSEGTHPADSAHPPTQEQITTAEAASASSSAGPPSGAVAVSLSARELQCRQEWFENLSQERLPAIAIMPDAQICLCSRTAGSSHGTAATARAGSSHSGWWGVSREPRHSHADVEGADQATSVTVDLGYVAGHDTGGPSAEPRQGGSSAVAAEQGGALYDADSAQNGAGVSSGPSAANRAAEGEIWGRDEEGEEVPEEEEQQRLGEGDTFYFFKMDVLIEDFAHVLQAGDDVSVPRAWHGGLLQGLSDWFLASASVGLGSRKASRVLDGGAGMGGAPGGDSSVSVSGKGASLMRGKSGSVATDRDGGEGGDVELSWKGRSGSRVLEGVLMALAGRGGVARASGGAEEGAAEWELEGQTGRRVAMGSVGLTQGAATVPAHVEAV